MIRSSEREEKAATVKPVQLTLFGPPAEGLPDHDTPAAPAEEPAASRAPENVLHAATAPSVSHVKPQATTLKAAIEEYAAYLVAMNRAKHTRDSFGLDLKLLLEHLGDVRLTDIGERDLRSFISWVRLQRLNNPTSVRRKVASLKNFFSYLHRERAMSHDPSLRLIYPEIFPALPEFLEEPQVEALLAAASEHLSWQALLQVMLDTGLKRDEVVALGQSDVFLGDAEDQRGYLVVRETQQAKRLRSRRLELSPPVVAILRLFRSEQPAGEQFFELSPRGVNFIVETCGKRARIVMRGPKLTPQILRETFAVRHMRAMVAREDALRATGVDEESIGSMIERHDLQLLRLLGLHEEPESAKKYRKLVRGWASPTVPPD